MFRLIKKDAKDFKSDKPFLQADILIYSLIILSVLLSFLLIFPSNRTSAYGIYGLDFYCGNELAATYRFAERKFSIKNGFTDKVFIDENKITVYFNENQTEYNVIEIDDEHKKASVIYSTCAGHDCEQTTVSKNGGFIYCAPHKLKVVICGDVGNYSDPVTG